MARYRIHRIRESVKESFRWQAHTGGAATVKPKDYEPGKEVEAATPYALWTSMKAEGNALCPGDILETIREDGTTGDLQIFKYIGFEPAKWWIAEPKPEFRAKVDEPVNSAAATMGSQSG
jgi:hypothetical protein